MTHPDIRAHIQQSEHNEELVNILRKNFPEYSDWIITGTFYFALHRVQAALWQDHQLYPDKHEHEDYRRSRNKLVSMLYPSYWKTYFQLYNESWKARYNPKYYTRIKLEDIEPLIEQALSEFKRLP